GAVTEHSFQEFSDRVDVARSRSATHATARRSERREFAFRKDIPSDAWECEARVAAVRDQHRFGTEAAVRKPGAPEREQPLTDPESPVEDLRGGWWGLGDTRAECERAAPVRRGVIEHQNRLRVDLGPAETRQYVRVIDPAPAAH